MADKQVSSGWRTTAIIFIILFILLLGMVVALYLVGSALQGMHDDCNNYCSSKHYESFYFDDTSFECSCYLGNSTIETFKYR